jgi:hypothetical protein
MGFFICASAKVQIWPLLAASDQIKFASYWTVDSACAAAAAHRI